MVGHLELGLRRQHIEAEEQAERTAYQLHSVFATSPGKHQVQLSSSEKSPVSERKYWSPVSVTQLGTEGRPISCQVSSVQPVSLSPPGDQLRLGARWLPAIYGQQVWSHHRLQQPLHQHHGGFPWRRPPLTFRLHINTQSTHPPHITPLPYPSLDRLTVLKRSASLVTSQLPLKHISTEPTSGIRGLGVQSSERLSDFHRSPPIGI